MERVSLLLNKLYFTNSTNAKEQVLEDYLRSTPDPDRGWAIAAISGTLKFDLFKRNMIKTLMAERMDETLFDLSRDYVGEISETVALAWPKSEDAKRINRLPSLSEVIHEFQTRNKSEIKTYLAELLDNMSPPQRWALLKLGTRGLRIGMSARSVKRVLAHMKGVDIDVIEELWHGLAPPYETLFAWIEGRAEKPDISDVLTYVPVMLAHPIEESDFSRIGPDTHLAEWKFDGIRVQLAGNGEEIKIFSRKGDDISGSFPDLTDGYRLDAVIDGELLVRTEDSMGSFNDLQKRLNQKKPPKKLIDRAPAYIIAYDILMAGDQNMRGAPLLSRRETLADLIKVLPPNRFELSKTLEFSSVEELAALRTNIADENALIEGLMIKDKQSEYVSGRPKHGWYKWKKDPHLLDAVLMYAQRGHGRRSSFYSDYTFGVWGEGEALLPIGKAYFGFTDEELKRLDKWIRAHKQQRLGPVQEVDKELVFEIAFDSAHESPRHKSGFALRFPRINRIRWDKPAAEANRIEDVAKLAS